MIKKPWRANLNAAKARCSYPSTTGYARYGGRGIRCLLTDEECERLWLRDSADKLTRPSLDRIDPDGHYEFGNCQPKENSVSKIKFLDEARIVCAGGYLEVHLAEKLDGHWNIKIKQHGSVKARIATPMPGGGTHYKFLDDLVAVPVDGKGE